MNDTMPPPDASTAPPRFTVATLIATIVALAAIALAIVWRFSPWTHQYFYGDDLDYFLSVRGGGCATQLSDILTATCQERFRPVASAFVIAMVDWFGAPMKYYNLVDFIIQFLNAALAFACARRLSGGRIVASAMVALAIGTSRFALFHTTQAISPVESITFGAALCCIYCVLRFDGATPRSSRWAIGALIAAFIAIYTHERFVVLAAWLLIALLSSPTVRATSRRAIFTMAVACLALPASYIAYKTFALDTTFMIGTGATHLGFDFGRILGFTRDGVLSIFGFNHGPDYLVGSQPEIGLNITTLLGATFATSWFVLLAMGVAYATRRRLTTGVISFFDAVRWPLLLAILACFTLFPALLTIRLEQRWLFAPFAFIALIAAWAAGRPSCGRARIAATGLACIFGLSSVAVDSVAMRHFDRIFLVYSAHFAEVAKRDIIDANPGASGTIRMIADESHCKWTLRNGLFFSVYGKAVRPTICYSSLDEATRDGLPPGTDLYAYSVDDRLVDMTDKVRAMMPGTGNGQSLAYDFLARYPDGKIDDPRHVDTPTGQGSLLLPVESTLGRREALVILSGFTYRYAGVDVPANATLHFGVSMIYPAPQPARLVVAVTPAGSTTRTLLSLDLVAPRPDQAALEFLPQSIDLSGLAGSKATFEFSVQSPGGDSTAHWVGLVQPTIVQRVATSIQSP